MVFFLQISVVSGNLFPVKLFYVTAPDHWTICPEVTAFAGKVICGVCSETSGLSSVISPSKVQL